MTQAARRRLSLMNKNRHRDWGMRAQNELLHAVNRNAARMARHLEAQGLLHDPRQILCALAARRLLPLKRPLMRPLPQPDMTLEALAFQHLKPADRRVLWPRRSSSEQLPAAREHLASALLRLTWNTQAARRSIDAPPDEY